MSKELAHAIPISDIERMGAAIAKSGLFGVKTPEQAVTLMLVAQADGLHPAVAARDYHVIQGRPALRSDAMLARFQQAGGRVEWITHEDSVVSGRFSHPQGGSVVIEWTFERAKNANLTNKETWRAYPRQMLRARVISEGVRAVFPGVAVGTYTVEEVQDFAPSSASSVDPSYTEDPVPGILDAPNLDELKTRYVEGVKYARKVKDERLESRVEDAKEVRKAELKAIEGEANVVRD